MKKAAKRTKPKQQRSRHQHAKPAKAKEAKGRVQIPQAIQTEVLIRNRHACCVCQKLRVQLHHIDGDPSNNDPENIAALCLDHHDMASMQIGLTKKLQPDQIRSYKTQWESVCEVDARALSRKRFAFYYSMYKNPPRLLAAYQSLTDEERTIAAFGIESRLRAEADKNADPLSDFAGTVPKLNNWTLHALHSAAAGEVYPSYLSRFAPHPGDPNYSTDLSTQEAMVTFHQYDLWCQVVAQVLAEARGTIPLEDLFKLKTESEINAFAGGLVTFRLGIYGKGLVPPTMWEKQPLASLQAREKNRRQLFRIQMQLRNMYLFSNTASVNLKRAKVSGLGVFGGAVKNDAREIVLTIIPLLIGMGGPNLWL